MPVRRAKPFDAKRFSRFFNSIIEREMRKEPETWCKGWKTRPPEKMWMHPKVRPKIKKMIEKKLLGGLPIGEQKLKRLIKAGKWEWVVAEVMKEKHTQYKDAKKTAIQMLEEIEERLMDLRTLQTQMGKEGQKNIVLMDAIGHFGTIGTKASYMLHKIKH